MLFNSYEFIFLFLPITLAVFHLIGKQGRHRMAISWLVGSSLFFYGWWNPAYLGLMLFSILFNYSVGVALGGVTNKKNKYILVFGIVLNLFLLGYYKYANFFVKSINDIVDSDIVFNEVILPLAISFFTFQQISYLVDTYRGETREYNFLHYCLFVTFFPQLIAGPIVHHKEMLPQFARDSLYSIKAKNISIGITIFAIGLFKKVILADGISVYATPVFNAADTGVILTFFEAWGGALAYTFQLYFDFSGYSDMAIGIARMFGVRLPLNFNSPYKSTSIIEFWRKWHITLSRFLRDYLYIPLGGSYKGEMERLKNLIITMLLGGLWHGAGWTFILWGGLHGFFLIVNTIWRRIRIKAKIRQYKIFEFVSWVITMICVVIAWVPFRSQSLDGAKNILSAMFGFNGMVWSPSWLGSGNELKLWLLDHGVVIQEMYRFGEFRELVLWILFMLVIVTTLPNVRQIMCKYGPTYEIYKGKVISYKNKYKYFKWNPNIYWAIFTSIIFFMSVSSMTKVSEFLYFRF
jgi:alginate O-acetyltransferase complex protein AlgI